MSESSIPSRKLPPTDRDFEIYEAVHIQHRSTWFLADRYRISQTRVRQIVRRVVEWLGEVLPPQAQVAKEQELHLARQIAADRFQHQLEEVTQLWEESRELKYAGIRIRLTTAQARLGAVGGVAAGLAADAIEGIEVPVYVPPPEPAQTRSAVGNALRGVPDRSDLDEFPEIPDLEVPPTYPADPVAYCDITEEAIAAREAAGCPFPYKLVKYLYEHGYLPRRETTNESNPKSKIQNPKSLAPDADASSPPPGDFSGSDENAAEHAATTAAAVTETGDVACTCDDDAGRFEAPEKSLTTPSQGLVVDRDALPVTELELDADRAGATLSVRKPPAPPAPLPIAAPLLVPVRSSANNG